MKLFEILVKLFKMEVKLFEILVKLFEILVRLFEMEVRLFEIEVRPSLTDMSGHLPPQGILPPDTFLKLEPFPNSLTL